MLNAALRDQLLQFLERKERGRLTVDLGGTEIQLYVLHGQVLAAQSSTDDTHLLRRLICAKVLNVQQTRHLKKLAAEEGVRETIWDVLDEPLCARLSYDRFRENLAGFLGAQGPARFEGMDALFVGQLHCEHDTRALMGDLEVLLGRCAALRTPTGLATLVQPGKKPTNPVHKRIYALLGEDTTVGQVVQTSPLEELATLDTILSMMDQGQVIAQAAMMPEEFDEEELLAELEAPRAAARGRKAPEPSPSLEEPDEPEEPEELVDLEPIEPEPVEPDLESDLEPIEPEHPREEDTLDMEAEEGVSAEVNAQLAEAGYHQAPDETVYDQELSMFADNDAFRGGGQEGHFSKTQAELDADRIDLSFMASTLEGDTEELVEMPEAPAGVGGVKMNFGGPALDAGEAARKIGVANQVLRGLSDGFDAQDGSGAGPAQIQLLLDGSPTEFAALFTNLQVGPTGEAATAGIIQNLRRRPPTEHRRLLNRGLANLIERAMNLGAETLDDDHVDAFLESCVGYQTRLGL